MYSHSIPLPSFHITFPSHFSPPHLIFHYYTSSGYIFYSIRLLHNSVLYTSLRNVTSHFIVYISIPKSIPHFHSTLYLILYFTSLRHISHLYPLLYLFTADYVNVVFVYFINNVAVRENFGYFQSYFQSWGCGLG